MVTTTQSDSGQVQEALATRARSVADHSREAIYTLDRDWRFTYVNPVAARLLSRSAEQLPGQCVWDDFPELLGTELERVYRAAVRTGARARFTMFYAPVGRRFEVNVYPDALGLTIVFRDADERTREREHEAAASQLMNSVVDVLPASTVIIETDGRILTTNRAWRRVSVALGRLDERDANYFDIVSQTASPDAADQLREALFALEPDDPGVRSLVDLCVHIHDEPVWFQVQASRVPGSELLVIQHTDITGHVQARHTASWAARHDHLTQLANRAHLYDLLTESLQGPEPRPVTLLFIDLDGFKAINDEHGHDTGDDLLRLIAQRLQESVRADDTVARLGGDEFVVLSHPAAPSDAHVLEERLRHAFTTPFAVDGQELCVDISVGVASAEPHEDVRRLIHRADVAMYADKRRRREG